MGAKPRPQRSRGLRTEGLSDAYREWVCQSLAQGVSPAAICDTLIRQGVSQELALREVDIVEGATRSLRQRSKRFELQLQLQSELDVEPIDCLDDVSEDDFYRHYYSRNRAVLLRGTISHWPQCQQWSPQWLSEQFGDTVISVNDQRLQHPERMVDPERYLVPMRLKDLADTVETQRGNDIYMVSRNRALDGPLSPLLATLSDMPEFLEPKLEGRASLWLGPAGTLTPLHHDTTNVLFCQIYGSKRIRLVSPRHLPTLTGELVSTFYSQTTDTATQKTSVVTVEPGDALFLPVGWWHEIEALTPSISLSLTNFKRKNHFDWYRPGDF